MIFRSSPGRPLRRLLWVVLVVAMLAACSSGDDGDSGGGDGPDGAGQPSGGGEGGDGEGPINFTISEVRVSSMAPQPGPFPEDVWASVAQLLNAYLARAMVDPLRSGEPPGGLEPLFTPPALERLNGPDRASMIEDRISPVSGTVSADRANTILTLLTDRGGSPVLVNASLDIVLTVRSDDNAVEVARNGEVVLIQDDHGWRIDSYDMKVARDTKPA